MFRTQAFHVKRETEFLDEALRRILFDAEITQSADALIEGVSASEPLISDVLQTPQDIRYHAEGPFVHAHVKAMLCTVHAIQQEKLHLIDIEELRRLRGYEGEIEEAEELIKEHISFFEVFCLLHDAAKWPALVFSAPPGSEGERLGFNAPLTYELSTDAKRRVELRNAYRELFHEFASTHPNESARAIQKQFYEKYRIDVHYPHHDTLIYTPVYQALLDRFVVAHGLATHERSLMEDLIAHHMNFGIDFRSVNTAAVKTYLYFADKRGYDGDDYLDFAQVCLLLDMVCGSVAVREGVAHHRIAQFANALKSEHDYAPERRMQQALARETQKNRERNRAFQEAGLDGVSLMELLRMDPGPAFGKMLKQIHAALVGEAEMPTLPNTVRKELERRAGMFYQHIFKQGI